MASQVDICNLALSHLGEGGTVTAIVPPDGSAEAAACARFYPIARDFALGHPRAAWGFARKRATLSLLEEEPTASWSFSYGLPADCLRPLKVLLPESTDENAVQKFDLEVNAGGLTVLYTNVEEPELVYVAKVTDTTKWSPQFVIAVSHYLASLLVGPISKDRKEKEVQLKLFAGALADAAAINSMGRQATGPRDFEPAGIRARR